MKIRELIIAITLLHGVSLGAQERDIFEQFALQKRIETPGLEKNEARPLPNIKLPWDETCQKGFQPSVKMTTQSQLEQALAAMRKRYAPFMRDLAPKLPQTRKQYVLNEFQWRLLASEMRTDSAGNLYPIPQVEPTTDTTYQTVTIPHYTGPINKAEGVYRKQLRITAEQLESDHLYLHFNGVDYTTAIYLNGKEVGHHTGLFGAFEFDIKPYVHPGENQLEIHIFNDSPMMGDNFFLGPNRKFGKKLAACGGPGWDEPGLGRGWTMCPVGFGIWQRCYLETRPDAYIRDIYIRPRLEESKADVCVEVANARGKELTLSCSLYGQNFKATVVRDRLLGAVDRIGSDSSGLTVCRFTLDLAGKPLKVWSLDEPWLYQLQVRLEEDNRLVDAAGQQFGMRSFTESTTSTPKGRFYLNGQEIKLRGANMMGNLMQCVIRQDFDQLRDDILLAKLAGMTYWRMTQQPCQPEVYDYFDKLGMLAQTDMPAFNGYRQDAVEEVKPQFIELMKLVRNHPSNAVISYCNEPDFTKPMMLNRAQHEALFSRFDDVASAMNPGQVTKWIDGDYINLSRKHSDHHCYETWYGNSMRTQYFGGWFSTVAGWMYSCGEFGAEGLDRIELMEKYFPPEWLTIDAENKWDPNRIPRCQTATTGKHWLNIQTGTREEWVRNSREYQMWATRLFTEALRRQPKMNSFAIHLLIDAWPSSWLKAIVDTERKAKPAYFAYRDALRPIAVNLRPDAFYGFSGDTGRVAVFVCNDTPEACQGGELRYQTELDGTLLSTGRAPATVPASNPQFQGYLDFPLPTVATPTMLTVRVALFDAKEQLIHDSSYDIEVFPASDKGKKLTFPGGYPQSLIQ